MACLLRYGTDVALRLEVPAEALLAEFPAPRGTALRDPEAAMAAALGDPIAYPPLHKATFPGDRVALVLEDQLTQGPALVAGAVKILLDSGVRPHDISVVYSPSAPLRPPFKDPRSALPANTAKGVELVAHDPEDRHKLAYLASSTANRPIYLNRSLCDADLVLPIGCLRPTSSSGEHYGAHAGLFPAFSDSQTIHRFHAPRKSPAGSDHNERKAEADEVGWLLGISVIIRVIPGADGELLHVLAGEVKSVCERGQALCDQAWTCCVPRRAHLVVASTGADPHQQTWQNVARALVAALRVADAGGAIVICSDVRSPPGPALRILAEARDLESAQRQIRSQPVEDAWQALQLIEALERGSVYLVSQLDEDVVQRLGIAPVECPEDISRLVRQHKTCILLNNAQHVVPTAVEKS